MEQSISVAEKSADAATVAMNAAKATAQAAADQAEIARKTFVLVHRPRIRVINVSLGHMNRREPVFQLGQPLRAHVGIRNVGETDAQLITFRYRIFVTEDGQPARWPVNPKTISSFRRYQQTIAPGLGTIIEMEDEPVNDPAIGFVGWEVYIFGRITYLNDRKIGRSTAFAGNARCHASAEARACSKLMTLNSSTKNNAVTAAAHAHGEPPYLHRPLHWQ